MFFYIEVHSLTSNCAKFDEITWFMLISIPERVSSILKWCGCYVNCGLPDSDTQTLGKVFETFRMPPLLRVLHVKMCSYVCHFIVCFLLERGGGEWLQTSWDNELEALINTVCIAWVWNVIIITLGKVAINASGSFCEETTFHHWLDRCVTKEKPIYTLVLLLCAVLYCYVGAPLANTCVDVCQCLYQFLVRCH